MVSHARYLRTGSTAGHIPFHGSPGSAAHHSLRVRGVDEYLRRGPHRPRLAAVTSAADERRRDRPLARPCRGRRPRGGESVGAYPSTPARRGTRPRSSPPGFGAFKPRCWRRACKLGPSTRLAADGRRKGCFVSSAVRYGSQAGVKAHAATGRENDADDDEPGPATQRRRSPSGEFRRSRDRPHGVQFPLNRLTAASTWLAPGRQPDATSARDSDDSERRDHPRHVRHRRADPPSRLPHGWLPPVQPAVDGTGHRYRIRTSLTVKLVDRSDASTAPGAARCLRRRHARSTCAPTNLAAVPDRNRPPRTFEPRRCRSDLLRRPLMFESGTDRADL